MARTSRHSQVSLTVEPMSVQNAHRSEPLLSRNMCSVSMPTPKADLLRSVARLSAKRKRTSDKAVDSASPIPNGHGQVQQDASGSGMINASIESSNQPPLKRKRRDAGASHVASTYSLRGRRAMMSPVEQSTNDVSIATRSLRSRPNAEPREPGDHQLKIDTVHGCCKGKVDALVANSTHPQMTDKMHPGIRAIQSKRQNRLAAKQSLARKTRELDRDSKLDSASATPAAGSPVLNSLLNDPKFPNDNSLKGKRRPPGRRRKPNANDAVEAAMRRQLALKTSYRAIVKALKPALSELADRSVNELRESQDAHKKYKVQYQNILTELERRKEDRLDKLDAYKEEMLALLDRQDEDGRDYLTLKYEAEVKEITDKALSHCALKAINDYKHQMMQVDDDLTEDEFDEAVEPLRAAEAFTLSNKDQSTRFLEQKFESRARPFAQIDKFAAREQKRSQLRPWINRYTKHQLSKGNVYPRELIQPSKLTPVFAFDLEPGRWDPANIHQLKETGNGKLAILAQATEYFHASGDVLLQHDCPAFSAKETHVGIDFDESVQNNHQGANCTENIKRDGPQ